MAAIEGLAELADRSVQAAAAARSVSWLDAASVDGALKRVDTVLAADRAALSQPALSPIRPSPLWRDRLAEMVVDLGCASGGLPGDPVVAAARAEADAEAAVAIARLGLLEAQRAVLRVRAAALAAGDSPEAADAIRGYRRLPAGVPAARYAGAVGRAAGGEITQVASGRSRSILVKLAVSLGIGLGYLVFLRLFHWESKAEMLPYLAPYAMSSVIGGVVCTNALSWDATRVRAALTGGARLWMVLVGKNISMFVLAGAVGLLLCVGLAWLAGEPSALVAAIAELVTMMLVWLGIGNVTSVLRPLRVQPLRAHAADRTLWSFLLTFGEAWVVGLGVNLMLTWKFWAKQSMINELGGIWVPVLLLTLSALFAWALLTVLAVHLAELPKVRRQLLREMIDYKSGKPAAASRAGAPTATPPAGQ